MISRVLVASESSFESILVGANFKSLGFDVLRIANLVKFDLKSLASFDPDVAYISLGFNSFDSIVYAELLRKWKPKVGLIFVTDSPLIQLLGITEENFPLGSQLVLRKAVTDIYALQSALHSSIEAAQENQKVRWIKTQTSVDGSAWDTSFNLLSATQMETFRLLSQGLSNLEIANIRQVSEKSVEHIIGRIALALNITSSTKTNQRVRLVREFYRIAGAPQN